MIERPRILRAIEGGEEEAVRAAAAALRRGGLVVLPTETVYGLAADPRVPGAEERLWAVKGRAPSKPIALLAAGAAEVDAFGVAWGERGRRLAARYWPGPLTLVMRVGAGWEGFRVPDHRVALLLLRAAGGVLRVTSANRSGEPDALSAGEAVRSIGPLVDVVIDAGAVRVGRPSTVVRVDGENLTVLREGAIPGAECLEI